MNFFEKELEELQGERKVAVGELAIAYHHAKRDVARKLSPSRAIRKHVGASLGLAAVAGYLIAPAKHSGGGVKSGGGMMGWAKHLVGLVVPGMKGKEEEKKVAAPAPAAESTGVLRRGLMTALLAQGVSFLRHNKDIHKTLGDIVQNLKKSGGGGVKRAAELEVGNGGAIDGVEFEMSDGRRVKSIAT